MRRKWNHIAEASLPLYSSFYCRWQIEERQNFGKHFKENALILDLGCGLGRDLRVFQNLGLTCVGLDFSKQMLSRCMVRNVVNGSETNIPFKTNTFDGVWSCSTAKYLAVRDLSKCLKEVRRVLKPNSLFWVGVEEGEGEKTESRGDIEITFNAYNNFNQILENHGFKILDVQRISAWRNFINFLCRN